MARAPSLAEYYRAHRAAFLLALELGCTPREAEREMARRQARERHRAASDRLEARMAGAPNGLPRLIEPHDDRQGAGQDAQPWMMRD